MTYENIKLNKDHFSTQDGYFYYIETDSSTLYEKTCDGNTAFTYPILGDLGSSNIKYMQYDGYYFWTLQDGVTSNDIRIKKWYIENYVCRLLDVIDLIHYSEYNYNVESFIMEEYDTILLNDLYIGDSSITIEDYYERINSGDKITIGPNDYNYYEEVTVTGTLESPNSLGLNFFIKNNYSQGVGVKIIKNIWFINNFSSEDIDSSLLKYSLKNESVENVLLDSDFENVVASSYYLDVNIPYFLFVLGSNLRFLNLDSLSVEKTMTLDNLELDQSTVIPIKAIHVENDTLYRLQERAMYYNSVYDFSSYNYQPSTIRTFIDSVTISVSPKILPSNGINTAEIKMSVQDQFARKVVNGAVKFSDSDSVGFITIPHTYTNTEGVATSYYKAGVEPNKVYIYGIATQYF